MLTGHSHPAGYSALNIAQLLFPMSTVRSFAVNATSKAIAAVSDIKVVGADPGVINTYHASIFGDPKWRCPFSCKECRSKAETKGTKSFDEYMKLKLAYRIRFLRWCAYKQQRYAVDAACDGRV
ncbi:hypothetical protein GGH93_001319 [Coemansia aciculifera]|nr:hypothetical protein GGH93_001319 [Coemansia aciculifera]